MSLFSSLLGLRCLNGVFFSPAHRSPLARRPALKNPGVGAVQTRRVGERELPEILLGHDPPPPSRRFRITSLKSAHRMREVGAEDRRASTHTGIEATSLPGRPLAAKVEVAGRLPGHPFELILPLEMSQHAQAAEFFKTAICRTHPSGS